MRIACSLLRKATASLMNQQSQLYNAQITSRGWMHTLNGSQDRDKIKRAGSNQQDAIVILLVMECHCSLLPNDSDDATDS